MIYLSLKIDVAGTLFQFVDMRTLKLCPNFSKQFKLLRSASAFDTRVIATSEKAIIKRVLTAHLHITKLIQHEKPRIYELTITEKQNLNP